MRKAESAKRAMHRDSIEMRDKANYKDKQKFHFDNTDEVKQTDACYTKNYFIVNPLAYWSDSYIWNYIESEKIETNPLYKQGYSRIGCIGCPMAGKHRAIEFERYPKYKERFLKLATDILERNCADGLKTPRQFRSGEDYFNWWLGDASVDTNDAGPTLFDYKEYINEKD